MDNLDAELIERIAQLKKKRNAVILAHNYQLGEIQDIADFVGDNLELIREAVKTEADVIICCGVEFLAETMAILRPDKTVLVPELHADCPLANMVTAARLKEMKKEHPGAIVVAYIKTPAAVKAESDICCATENAVKIIKNMPADREIIFVPDQYFGSWVAAQTGRDLILWPGYCNTHLRTQARDIIRLKNQYPAAKVIVHPQCRTEVVALADAVLSTSGMVGYARTCQSKEIIVATEVGMLHRLRKENPETQFFAASEDAVCHRMKLVRLETILWSLDNMTHLVKVPERIARKARPPIEKMLEG